MARQATKARHLLKDALELPAKERARIAHELLVSIDEGPAEDPSVVERAWAAELTRRADAVRSGKTKTIPWSEARRQILSGLARRRRRRAR